MSAALAAPRPHLLGIDDAPFVKHVDRTVPVVGVMMEGHDLVEAVAVTELVVDGDDAAGFIAAWVRGLRFAPAVDGIVLGGISIAGLGIVDVAKLSESLDRPVIVVNRRRPQDAPIEQALRAAGLENRIEIVRRSPPAEPIAEGLWASWSGADRDLAHRLLSGSRGKSLLPEPLRVAHLIGGALGRGQSRGRP